MSSNIRTIFRAAGLNFTGSIIKAALGLAAVATITRYLEPSQYGIFVLGTTIVYIANRIISFGIPSAFSFFIPKFTATGQQRYIRSVIRFGLLFHLLASLLLVVIVLLFSDRIAVQLFHSPELAGTLRILILSLPFLILIDDLSNIFTGFRVATTPILYNNFFHPLLRMGLIIGALLAGYSLLGMAVVHTLAVAIVALAALLLVRTKLLKTISLEHERFSRREILRYSLPLSFSEMIFLILSYTDITMIGYYLQSTDVGMYHVAHDLAKVLNYLPIAVLIMYKPVLSSLFANRDTGEIKHILSTVSRWIMLINIPVTAVMLIAPRQILTVFFGSEYAPAAELLQVLVVAFFVVTAFGPIQSVFEASGKTKVTLINAMVSAGLNIVLNVLFISRFGAVGAALATGISIMTVLLLSLIEIRVLFRIHPFSRQFIIGNLIGAGLVIVFRTVSQSMIGDSIFSIAAAGLIYVVAYGGLMLIFRVISVDNVITLLRQFVKRFRSRGGV